MIKKYTRRKRVRNEDGNLFTKEEIDNISALIDTLKQIRQRLKRDGIDFEAEKNKVDIQTAFMIPPDEIEFL